ncbi:DegT/DnrJ/EryC1/StrS family aminotransferase [Phytohabitans suffuscus]|uniref:Aminotransferase DegT n=1 Tax=Phytohabitans suffuscus TaxID=624315 RepID=A0A6F8YRR7_9ACTN|nr:DegT/DnrJ/EryC1/StrS family aminotransferase [Phytohabitans suffuscus]BCB88531.1 aminotransferase DegT [Phytohabitans suffuscus]
MIPLFKVAMSPAAMGRVADVFSSGMMVHGPTVGAFEEALRRVVGNPHLAAVNNGTSALHLAMRLAADPGPDAEPRPAWRDEVLATPLTFEAATFAVLANGLRLRWVDVDPGTFNLDLDDLARKISPATAAISLVHWAGYPVDLDRLDRILDRAQAAHGHRPLVVEDCAHAWGTTLRGRRLGGHGNVCVFSFHALKHLTCGSGGMITLPDQRAHERVRLLRWLGIDRRADRTNASYDVPEWGYNFQMSDVSAAIGLANLEIVEGNLRRHRDNAAYYDDELAGVPGLELTDRAPGHDSSFWLYPVKVRDRDGFMRKLTEAGVATSRFVRRNDAHSAVREAAAPLPGLDSVYDQMVYIPVGWWLTPEDRAHVAKTIRSGW